jgi:hypothetical protein
MTRVSCRFVTRPKKRTNCQKKKTGWLLSILCSTGGGDGKKYGWFGRELQREDNFVKGACCVGGQRVYLNVNAEETRKVSVETIENLPAELPFTSCFCCCCFLLLVWERV